MRGTTRTKVPYVQGTCRCGHTTRGHGPTLEDTLQPDYIPHRRCMWCACEEYTAR